MEVPGQGNQNRNRNTATQVVQEAQTALGSLATNQSGQTTWPVRWLAVPEKGSSWPVSQYRGPNLVGLSNRIESKPYEITEGTLRDKYAELAANPTTRAFVQNRLKQKGFYGGSRVGIPDNDLSAIRGWLEYSNTIGVTADRALEEMLKSIPDYDKGGGGPRYRVSNPADIRVAVKRAFMDTIGRGPTEQELAAVVPGFQQAQIQGQMGTTAAPDVTTFAEGAAQFLAPTEAQGYKFLNSVNRLFNALGGV